MIDITEIRRSNLELLLANEFSGNQSKLANAIGTQAIYLNQLLRSTRDSKTGRPRTMGSVLARRIETALSKPHGWMDTLHTSEAPAMWGPSAASLPTVSVSNSPRVQWGEKMPTELPSTFAVEIPDDAMAPRVRRGDVVRFTTELKPRPGDGVLVCDGAGHWFFRCYSERRPGDWEAVALNSGYQPLDSKAHQLAILGILIGIETQRWG